MKSKILTTLLSCAALAVLSASASAAAVMTYTQTATLSGSLGGTSFTNAAVTLRMSADTANIQPLPYGSFPAWSNAGVTTIDIDGFDTATFNGSSDYGVYAIDVSYYYSFGVVGFARLNSFSQIWATNQYIEPSYSLATENTFTGAFNYGAPSSTTLGELVFNGASGSSTFTAAAVPEPSACALLGLGAVGLVARRRRA